MTVRRKVLLTLAAGFSVASLLSVLALHTYFETHRGVRTTDVSTSLLVYVLACGAVVLLVGTFIAYQVDRQILRRLAALSREVAALPEREAPRLPPAEGNDEIDRLARTIDGMLAGRELSERVRREEERLREAVLSATPAAIYLKDPAGRLLMGNDYFASFFPRPIPDLLGKTLGELAGGRLSPDEIHQLEASDRLALEGREDAFPIEETFPDATGAPRIFATRKTSLVLPERGRCILGVSVEITERKRLEEELRRRMSEYRLLTEETEDVIWTCDMDLNTLYISPAFERIFGYPLSEAFAQGITFTLTPASLETAVTLRDEIRRRETEAPGSARPPTMLLTHHHRDGRLIPCEVRTRFLRDAEGRIERIVGVTRDMTEQQKAEEALRRSEQRFREALAVTRNILYRYDAREDRYDYISAHAETVFGWTKEELARKGMADARAEIHPDDLPSVEAAVAEEAARRPTEPVSIVTEYRRRMKSGEYRWVSDWATLLFDADGELEAVIGSAFDITERKTLEAELKRAREETEERVVQRTRELGEANARLVAENRERQRAEEEFRRSEQRYRRLLENIRDVVYSMDTEGRVLSLNPAYEVVTGLPREEMLGRSFTEAVHPEDIPQAVANFRNTLAGRSRGPYVVRLRVVDGYRYGEISSSPLLDEEGGVAGALGVIRDVTERKAAEEAMVHAERMAAVGTLAAGVAHEYNNIHTSLLGYLDLLGEQTDLAAEPADHLRRARRAARRAAEVTHNLLDFARQREENRSHASLNQIVQEALTLASPQIARARVALEVETADLPPLALDAPRIVQVALNLVLNALHALSGREDGTIRVETLRTDAACLLRVADNGCGIAPADRPRLFLPFFTTKGEHAQPGSPLARVRGTGLGLSVCDTIVKHHGGRIEVESEPGKGSVFTVRLPLDQANASDEEPSTNEATQSPRKKRETDRIEDPFETLPRQVLLVEEDAGVREYLTLLLEREGFRISSGGSLEAFRPQLEAAAFDRVLLDADLPSGRLEACFAILRALPPKRRPRLLLASGEPGAENTLRADGLAVAAFLEKPFVKKDLLAALHGE